MSSLIDGGHATAFGGCFAHPTTHAATHRPPSSLIRKQLDRIVEAAPLISAAAPKREFASEILGEGAPQKPRRANSLGQGFHGRAHVDRGADAGEVERAARADIAVH